MVYERQSKGIQLKRFGNGWVRGEAGRGGKRSFPSLSSGLADALHLARCLPRAHLSGLQGSCPRHHLHDISATFMEPQSSGDFSWYGGDKDGRKERSLSLSFCLF